MRAAPLLLLMLAGPALAEAPKAPRPAGAPAIGCASLANYRLLMRQAQDAAGAAAVLADPKADHLGCSVPARDAVTGISDHVVLDGRAYECVSVQNTGICLWTEAGSIAVPPEKPARAAGPKPPEPAKLKR